jgi:hypothetical protein
MFPPMPAALCRLKISSVQRPAEGINQIAGVSNLACHSLSASLQVVPSKTRDKKMSEVITGQQTTIIPPLKSALKSASRK